MRINILGVGFDNVTMDEALARGEELLCSEGAHYVVTPNPEIVETCRADAAANAAVNGADLVLPDGIGIVYGAKILHQPLRGRVPGIEFGTGMIERCAKLGKSVYLLGAKPGVAEQAAENLKNRFPGLVIAGTHDGYFKEDAPIAAEIKASGADMALVCLGAPKQELFMAKYGEATGCHLLMGLGGSMDIFAGVAQRAPEFYCKHNLEWFYRLTKITGNVNVTINVRESSRDTGAREDIVINEIESNGDATDWVEIYNKGTKPVDISGWYITDDNTGRLASNKTTPLAQGTILAPGGHYVFDQYVNFDFGLGAPDEVNLFDETGRLVEKYSWSTHAAGVYARIPDGTGAFTDVANSTKGTGNVMTEPDKPSYPNAIAWPGSDKVITYDDGISMFQSDSSGLDFYNGKLYCINNKKGTFWVLDVNKDGTMDYSEGFTKAGKNLAFMADAANPEESNPDAEGITVDDAGNAYAAVERDNNNKNVNCNVILKFNPWENSPTVVASSEWDITRLLPDVPESHFRLLEAHQSGQSLHPLLLYLPFLS